MKDSLFILWFLVTASDAIGAGLAAVMLFRLGTRFGKFLGWLAVAIAFESVVAAASLILLWPQEVSQAPVFAMARTCGRGVKSAAVWALAVYLLGLCRKRSRDAHITRSGAWPGQGGSA